MRPTMPYVWYSPYIDTWLAVNSVVWRYMRETPLANYHRIIITSIK